MAALNFARSWRDIDDNLQAVPAFRSRDDQGVVTEQSAHGWHFGLAESLESLERDWRQLEADNRLSLHQSYDWCRSWYLTHGNPLAIVTASRNGKLAMILPLEIQRQHMIRTARFIGGRFNNLNTGLFSADALDDPSEDFAEELSDALQLLLRDRADLVIFSQVPAVWRGTRNPLAGLSGIEHQNHSFQLQLKPSMDETIAQLDRKTRRKRHNRSRRLLEDAGGYQHVVAYGHYERHALLTAFFEQKAARFAKLGLPDVFASPEIQGFFRMLSDISASEGDRTLALHALKLKGDHAGHIASIAGISRKGDHVICQFQSIDDSIVGSASPGEFLYWLMIERLIAEGVTLLDLGLGDQRHKRAWCPIETVPYDYMVALNPLGMLAAFVERGTVRAKAAIKSNPAVYRTIQRLRSGGIMAKDMASDRED